jgi:hypothetical protein
VRGRRYAIGMVLLVGVLFVGAVVLNAAYTSRVQENSDRRQAEERRRQDRRWCDLLTSLDQPQTPATTERGRELQRQVHQLRKDMGCL